MVTGFPGFIASRLLARLADQERGCFHLLVEPRFAKAAEDACRQIEGAVPSFRNRWRILPGDLARSGLALSDGDRSDLARRVTRVWHLAAVYDLAVEERLAREVNVEGTRRLLDLCEGMHGLEAFFHISTCYVAGDRTGRILESDLDCGQRFKNHYESTKYGAEAEVRSRSDRLPVVVFRPAIVVGDSNTGETAKADGPYFMMGLLLRLPHWVPMVRPGASRAPVNLVPVDFLVEALAALSADPRAVGRTFHLADPNPLSAREILDILCDAVGRKRPVATAPRALAVPLLRLGPVQRRSGIPAQALPYFDHPADFDVANTMDLLRGTGVSCPSAADVLPVLVAWAREHKEIFKRPTRLPPND